jgi:hypothetical protein
MKYDILLMRMFSEDNPLTEEEQQWVNKQAATQKLVAALYMEHVNKVNSRSEPKGPVLVDFHVSLGDQAQESSVFEILQSLLNIDYTKADMKWVD